MGEYELTRDVWAVDEGEFPADGTLDEQARFLLRYAILAPSSHNAQPWTFAVDGDVVTVAADESRWLSVADDDRRELHLSLGCAVENLCIAAEYFGFDDRVEYPDEEGVAAVVTLDPDGDPATPSALFEALTDRRTSHQVFADRPLDPATVDRFHRAIFEDEVDLLLVDDPDRKRAVGQLQAEADERQMDDPEYRRELGRLIGAGTLGDSWLEARIGRAVVTFVDVGDREGRKNATLVRSAPALGVLVTDADDPTARVKAGQVFERLALVAADAGVAVHPMSQTLERPETRERLTTLVGLEEGVPQHLFRLGYATETQEHTPRWPVEKFLAE